MTEDSQLVFESVFPPMFFPTRRNMKSVSGRVTIKEIQL